LRRWLLACTLLVAISRLLVIPGVPWEQDEALFAAAAFDTNIVEHRPHPPGFPLWVGIGKIGNIVLGDPVLALQLTSAISSIALVPLLALLWSPVLGPSLGLAAALLWSFLPGVWFHAPRAFTTTPALALAAAACLAWSGSRKRGFAGGWALLALAILVRPVLTPPLLIVGLAAMWLRRERGIAIAGGLALTAALIAVGFVPIVADTGGVLPFLAALTSHASEQATGVGTLPWAPSQLGVVRDLGGVVPAVVTLLLGLLGWVEVRKHHPRPATAIAVVTIATAAWLLLAHNRTYPRYPLPLLALWAGPVMAGLRRLAGSAGRAVALSGAAALTGLVWTMPAMTAQAQRPFPPLAALASARGRAVVVEGGASPFMDLLVLSKRDQLPFFWRPLLSQGRQNTRRVSGSWSYVWSQGSPPKLIPAAAPAVHTFDVNCRRLRYLSQQRYLSASLADRGAIVLVPDPIHIEADRGIEISRRGVVLLTQPAPGGSRIGLVTKADEAGRIEISLAGVGSQSLSISRGRQAYHLPVPRHAGPRHQAGMLRLVRADQGPGSVHLLRAWIDDGSFRAAPGLIRPESLAGGMDGLLRSRGFYNVERLGNPPRAGRWTRDAASLSLPSGPGPLLLELCAPRPGGASVTITTSPPTRPVALHVSYRWTRVSVPTRPDIGRIELHVTVKKAFIPARSISGSADRRRLGVVLGAIRYLPRTKKSRAQTVGRGERRRR